LLFSVIGDIVEVKFGTAPVKPVKHFWHIQIHRAE
jgi:hypothetical protein